MIHCLICNRHAFPFEEFLGSWGASLSNHIRILPYTSLPICQPCPAGTYLFSDLERLLPAELFLASRLADQLLEHPESYRVINPPQRWISRHRFLERLHQDGINEFRAFRLDALPEDLRYPVFLRRTDDHSGSRTPLLRDRNELNHAIARIPAWERRIFGKRFIVCEFCDTADNDGVYRKYSAIKIGDEIIPRHVLFSRNWLTKTADMVDTQRVAEEEAFLEHFTHAKSLGGIFERAGLDYGRIDYGMRDGRIQVWEINSNPVIVPAPKRLAPERLLGQSRSAERIVSAWEKLIAESPGAPASYRAPLALWPLLKMTQILSLRYDGWRH